MSLEKIHQVMDEVLGTAYTNKALGDLKPHIAEEDRIYDDGPDYESSAQVDQIRDYIADVLMDYLMNNRDPAYVYTMLKDKIGGLELSALIGEVDRLREEKPQ